MTELIEILLRRLNRVQYALECKADYSPRHARLWLLRDRIRRRIRNLGRRPPACPKEV